MLIESRAARRIQIILISRFLLNLRRTHEQPITSSPSRFSIPVFRIPTPPDIVEDMGRSLNYTWERGHEDAEFEVYAGPPMVQSGPGSVLEGNGPDDHAPFRHRD